MEELRPSAQINHYKNGNRTVKSLLPRGMIVGLPRSRNLIPALVARSNRHVPKQTMRYLQWLSIK